MSKLDKEFEFYKKRLKVRANMSGEKYIRIINNRIVFKRMNWAFSNSLWYRGVYLAFSNDFYKFTKVEKETVINICKAIDTIKDSDILSLIYDI